MISSIEVRHNNQVKEMETNYAQQISSLSNKNKSLDSQLHALREELEGTKRTRLSEFQTLEKKLAESMERESAMINELEHEKSVREKRSNNQIENFEEERNRFKRKIVELEIRVKEIEQTKGDLFLKHEKERAKMALERDHLLSQRNEAQDMVERLEKRKEALLKEIEMMKLRSSSRGRLNFLGKLSRNSSLADEERTITPTIDNSPKGAFKRGSPLRSLANVQRH